MLSRRVFVRLALLTPPLLVLPTACTSAGTGVTAKLDHGPIAPLGEIMTFTLTATSAWDAPDPDAENGMTITTAEVFFGMTDGLVPLNLDDQWQVIREQSTGVRYIAVLRDL